MGKGGGGRGRSLHLCLTRPDIKLKKLEAITFWCSIKNYVCVQCMFCMDGNVNANWWQHQITWIHQNFLCHLFKLHCVQPQGRMYWNIKYENVQHLDKYPLSLILERSTIPGPMHEVS